MYESVQLNNENCLQALNSPPIPPTLPPSPPPLATNANPNMKNLILNSRFCQTHRTGQTRIFCLSRFGFHGIQGGVTLPTV